MDYPGGAAREGASAGVVGVTQPDEGLNRGGFGRRVAGLVRWYVR